VVPLLDHDVAGVLGAIASESVFSVICSAQKIRLLWECWTKRSHPMKAVTANAVQRIWPAATVGLAVSINAVWVAALGYAIWAFF
jgi:hypothetical protein